MRLKTKYFGAVDCPDEERVHFAAGLFGFEEEHEFLLLPFEGSAGSLLCFQSTQTPALAFVAMDPFSLSPDYAPVLQPRELKDLGVQDSQELGFYVLCAVKNPVSASTVNLKCPLVIDPITRKGMQVILSDPAYQYRHRFDSFSVVTETVDRETEEASANADNTAQKE